MRVGKRCQTEQIVIFQKERHNLEMLFSAKTYLAGLSTLIITIDESKLEDKEDSG